MTTKAKNSHLNIGSMLRSRVMTNKVIRQTPHRNQIQVLAEKKIKNLSLNHNLNLSLNKVTQIRLTDRLRRMDRHHQILH